MNDRVFRASQAHKLEDPQRRIWLPLGQIVEALALRPSMVVADIGAGTGYFSIPMAESAEAPQRIYAVDLQPEMLALLRAKLTPALADRIVLREGTAIATTLPDASCDLVLLANIWHELDNTADVLSECRRILRPDGRIAILDWRDDVNPEPGPPLHHRISSAVVTGELRSHDWKVISNSPVGEYSYLVIAAV